MLNTATAIKCSYDSGSATGCDPMCDRKATHVVVHANGSYGPFNSPVCGRHVAAMSDRVARLVQVWHL
jgi:hypothetical protein